MFEELPIKLEPVYVTKTANARIGLHQGSCVLRQGGSEIQGVVSIGLEWLPTPRIAISFRPSDLEAMKRVSLGPADLELLELQTSAQIQITRSPMLFWLDETRPAQGRVAAIEFGDLTRCARIRFHIPNFTFFNGQPVREGASSMCAERAVLEHGGFRIIINRAQPYGDPLEDDLPREGGYGITHVGQIEHLGGTAFALADALPVLDCLSYFLSFCRAAWTCPILLCAEDCNGAVIGERWALDHLVDRYKNVMSWLPTKEHVYSQLFQVFQGYAVAFFSTLWGKAVRVATQWYVESSTGAIEKSIVLTQAAFEVIAWTRLVLETSSLSATEWSSRSLPFAEKLRRLLTTCSIPETLPTGLTSLAAYSAECGAADGPQVLTSVRNSLVHPNLAKLERLQRCPAAAADAWAMGLWYLDLLLLHISGFSGRYSNRTVTGCWRGEEIMLVPWA